MEKKPWVVLLSVLALGALTVLSVSLGSVSFGSAQPIGREEAEPLLRPSQSAPAQVGEDALYSRIALWLSLVVLVSLVGLLLSPEGRKRLIRFLIRLALTLWGLYYLLIRYPEVFNFLAPPLPAAAPRPQDIAAGASAPPPVFTPPEENSILSYAIGMLFILVMIFVAWRAYRVWQALSQRQVHALREIGRIARTSLRDLSDGRETTDVIMNCYFRMSDTVSDRRNLQRGLGMTPSEFASRLEGAGLPGDAVRRLTRLFEGVRYGAQKAGPKDVNEAVACLTTILQYCGEPL